jgi:hypothetical protein
MDFVKPASATLSLLLLFSACDRTPKIATDTTANSRVEAQPLNGQSYRTRDGRLAITLISSEELEYRVRDGTTLLCKYSSQQDALRVIMTAFGTQQVLYFRRVPNGLLSNDGILYLSPSGLAEIQRQEELAMRAHQEAQAAEERQRVERERLAVIAAQRQAEEQRLADERARKEAPEKLRALLTTRPVLGGIMGGYGGATLRVMSFDSGTGSVSAELDFIGHGRTGSVYDPPLAKSPDGHSSRAVGNVSGDTLNLTATWTEKRFLGEVDKGLVRLKLRYDGSARKLVGPAYWGNQESEWLVMSFDLK